MQLEEVKKKAKMGYLAFVPEPALITRLHQEYPPSFREVAGKHITVQFGVPSDHPLAEAERFAIVGHGTDGAIEAFVVEVDGSTQRPDGKLYHLTWSYDPATRKAKDSGAMLAKYGFRRVEPIWFDATARFIPMGQN